MRGPSIRIALAEQTLAVPASDRRAPLVRLLNGYENALATVAPQRQAA